MSVACPADYGYSAAVLRRSPELTAETIYVVGGLYGNPEALEAVLALQAQEARRGAPVTLVCTQPEPPMLSWDLPDSPVGRIVFPGVLTYVPHSRVAVVVGPWRASATQYKPLAIVVLIVTVLIAAEPGKRIKIPAIFLWGNGTATLQLEYGTGTACANGTTS